MCVCLVTQSCPTLCNPMDCSPPGSSVHGDSPGKNTGVRCHALLQGIFPTQGSNPGLLHCRRILFPSEPPGKPKNTTVGSLSLLQGIFPTQELNWVSCIAGRFLTSWATREAHIRHTVYYFPYIHNFTCLCHSWHSSTCSLSQMGPLMFIIMRNIPPHKPRSQQLSLKFFTHLFLLLSHLFVDSQSCLKSSTSRMLLRSNLSAINLFGTKINRTDWQGSQKVPETIWRLGVWS